MSMVAPPMACYSTPLGGADLSQIGIGLFLPSLEYAPAHFLSLN